MSDIRDGFDALDQIVAIAENAQNIGPSDVRRAMDTGVKEAERVARKHLVTNYKRSGLKRRTGELLGMIKRSVLSIVSGGNSRAGILLAFPGGLTKEQYQKANSLQYGAVRASKGSILSQRGANGRFLIGEKQRAKLKGAAQSMKPGDAFVQASRDISLRGVGKTENGSTMVDTPAGTATVTKAWNYFYLDNRQLTEVKDIIFQRAMGALVSMIRGDKRIRKAA